MVEPLGRRVPPSPQAACIYPIPRPNIPANRRCDPLTERARANGGIESGLAQVKAFRLMVDRSATWADWDQELLAFELQELKAVAFDLNLTGFGLKEIDDLLVSPDDDERGNATPPFPQIPVSRAGDLWACGPHRVLCGDATSQEAVGQLLGASQPILMVSDPPYGIELDSEWRDRAGLNGFGPAQASYIKQRTAGHTNTSISSDIR